MSSFTHSVHPHLTKLCGHTVLIGNPTIFRSRLQKFIDDGVHKLNVVADFDFTLTKFMLNGQRAYSCHRVLEECGKLGSDYHDKANALQKKYYPLEVSVLFIFIFH